MTDVAEVMAIFSLSESAAEQGLRNKKVTAALNQVIEACNLREPTVKANFSAETQGSLLYTVATKFPPKVEERKKIFVADQVVKGNLDGTLKVQAALDFMKKNHGEENEGKAVDEAAFKLACGVGVNVTEDDAVHAAKDTLKELEAELKEKRYQFPFGSLIAGARSKCPWGDPAILKRELDAGLLALLGPKTDADRVKPAKEKKKDKAKDANSKDTKAGCESSEPVDPKEAFKGAVAHFHAVGENYKTDGYVKMPKTMELLEAHKKRVDGKVRTRFPPEPNGILHIGHAKAMNLNFSYAKCMGGKCYLRFDDTNPEVEEERYAEGIRDMVHWLGHEPWKVTHASDNFDALYGHAVELIRKGLAYVDLQTQEQIRAERKFLERGEPKESPYRNTDPAINLKRFNDMKVGKYAEGTAALRLKMDVTTPSPNPQMWDIIAYRIKHAAHNRTGDKWCIYPTYDFTHCLCDSIEDITHSLCTTEFTNSRESYYWLCNACEVYCPVQWEYGRMNITHTVLSKRKILALIKQGKVKEWDDPRLHTLPGLRRRGFTPEAINTFCDLLGITTARTAVEPRTLEAAVRDDLNKKAQRASCVRTNPIKVTLTNWDASNFEHSQAPNNPLKPEEGTHTIPFGKHLLIDRDDWRDEGKIEKGYKRLTEKQPVGLKYSGYYIEVEKVERDAKTGEVSNVFVKYGPREELKNKTFIQWLPDPAHLPPSEKEFAPMKVALHMIGPLFTMANPEEHPDGWLAALNPESLVEVKDCYVDSVVRGKPAGTTFQFERIGYFASDPDHTPEGDPIMNLTVTLREDAGKQ
eukprot:Clim_evm6s182 gene=Clim_evmTU6s182